MLQSGIEICADSTKYFVLVKVVLSWCKVGTVSFSVCREMVASLASSWTHHICFGEVSALLQSND